MKRNCLLLAIGLLLALNSTASTKFGSITEKEARQLVREALIVMKQNDPGVVLEPFTYAYAPEFVAYEAMWSNPNGSGLIGYFAVNPWTGDVWEINACHKISSPEMKKIQALVWKRSKLIPEAEATLHEKAPGCTPPEVSKAGNEKPKRA